MKIIETVKVNTKMAYDYFKLLPKEAKVGIVGSTVAGAVAGDGIVNLLIGNTTNGIAKVLGGIGLWNISSVLIDNGMCKLHMKDLYEFYSKYPTIDDSNDTWISVEDSQIADSTDITGAI